MLTKICLLDWVWALCAYSLLQMSVLELQHWLGARFFVPDSWNVLPEIEQWDYHPAAPPTDLETADGSVDCVICLERIELGHAHPASQEGERERDPLLDKTRESLDAGMLFGRYSYMVNIALASRLVSRTLTCLSHRYPLVITSPTRSAWSNGLL